MFEGQRFQRFHRFLSTLRLLNKYPQKFAIESVAVALLAPPLLQWCCSRLQVFP